MKISSRVIYCATPAEWHQAVFDPAVGVQVNLEGISGVFRLPRRPFRSRARLREHLFWYLTEGACRGEVDGRPCTLAAGTLLWVAPGVPFRFDFSAEQRNTVHRFRLRVERAGRPVRLRRPFVAVPRSGAARSWFDQLIQESFTRDALTDVRTRGLVACLTTEIFRATQARPSAGTEETQLGPEQKRRVSDWLAAHIAGELTPRELAKHLGLSHDYFTRQFRATYGVPPRRWFVEERMRLAAHQLAESDLPIAHVAAAFGCADAYFFSRQFRQVLGASPRDYRRQAYRP